jgi:hypothetical protein
VFSLVSGFGLNQIKSITESLGIFAKQLVKFRFSKAKLNRNEKA